MEENVLDFSLINCNQNAIDNFSPEQILASDVVLISIIIDKSGSVDKHSSKLVDCVNMYINDMKNSHHANKILVQIIEFNEKVDIVHGFKPISQMSTYSLNCGGLTALYDAVHLSLANSCDYQRNLTDPSNSLDCKNIVLIITDGGDNSSKSGPRDCFNIIDLIKKEEINYNSFSALLVGVGPENTHIFEKAAKDMGIEKVKVITDSTKDIKDTIGLLSASTSSVAAGGNVTF